MNSLTHWVFSHWLTQEKFWVALSALITASALLYTITRNSRNHKTKKANLQKSLQVELITNVDSIFSGGVDRPLLFESMRTLRRDFVSEIKDMTVLGKLQRLYLELEHYANFVKKVYLTNSGIDPRFVTERQLITDNIFLEYFGHEKITYEIAKLQHADIGTRYIEQKRDQAIKLKEENINTWKMQLDTDVDSLF